MPLGAVPQAHEEEHEDVGHAGRQRAARVGAELGLRPLAEGLHGLDERDGVEDVVAHPGAERHVPATPEVSERGREVGLREVALHGDAEELRYALDDVDAAREVGVHLDGVGEHAVEHERPGDGARHVVEDGVHVPREHVGDGKLLEDAVPQGEGALAHRVEVGRALSGKLGHRLVVAVDGALDHLREPGDEEQEARVVALGRILAVVGVDEVAERHEGVEGDAEGQHDAEARGARGRAEVEEHHVEVLEDAQDDDGHGEEADEGPALACGIARLDGLALGAVLGGLAGLLGRVVYAPERESAHPDVERGGDQEAERGDAAHEDVECHACREQHLPLVCGRQTTHPVVGNERAADEQHALQ